MTDSYQAMLEHTLVRLREQLTWTPLYLTPDEEDEVDLLAHRIYTSAADLIVFGNLNAHVALRQQCLKNINDTLDRIEKWQELDNHRASVILSN